LRQWVCTFVRHDAMFVILKDISRKLGSLIFYLLDGFEQRFKDQRGLLSRSRGSYDTG
jgi:hypothetical protein